jgi:hypothetical protein
MAEKNINEISRDARTLFTKAQEAAQRENTDYAIALYNQVLEKESGFFECRKLLRADGRQRPTGPAQQSGQRAGNRRADFEHRPE